MTSTASTQRHFTLAWTLDAPRAQVFRAWTDPDHLDWFYNDRFPVPSEPMELDLRVGGVWRLHMIVDESTDYFTGGVYREIVPDEKLVFAWGATDGWPTLDPDRLDESPLVTVTLTEAGGCTEMIVHVELPAHLPDDGVPEWWSLVQNGWRDTVEPPGGCAREHPDHGLKPRARRGDAARPGRGLAARRAVGLTEALASTASRCLRWAALAEAFVASGSRSRDCGDAPLATVSLPWGASVA